MSENYELALALHLQDTLYRYKTELSTLHVEQALDDLGLKLVPLRGGADPQAATGQDAPLPGARQSARHPGDRNYLLDKPTIQR